MHHHYTPRQAEKTLTLNPLTGYRLSAAQVSFENRGYPNTELQVCQVVFLGLLDFFIGVAGSYNGDKSRAATTGSFNEDTSRAATTESFIGDTSHAATTGTRNT